LHDTPRGCPQELRGLYVCDAPILVAQKQVGKAAQTSCWALLGWYSKVWYI